MSEEESNESKEPVETAAEIGAIYNRKQVVRRVQPEEKLPFTIHLEELRWRLIYCVSTIGVAFCASFGLSDRLFALIRQPIHSDLYFMAPAEAFFVYMEISFYAAMAVSVPMILYQLWEFVSPGLLEAERKYTRAKAL